MFDVWMVFAVVLLLCRAGGCRREACAGVGGGVGREGRLKMPRPDAAKVVQMTVTQGPLTGEGQRLGTAS
ncbi:MAG: hypothetical protein QM755_21325 [Luteolibacter sp.]